VITQAIVGFTVACAVLAWLAITVWMAVDLINGVDMAGTWLLVALAVDTVLLILTRRLIRLLWDDVQ
jgi:hypothetical protein